MNIVERIVDARRVLGASHAWLTEQGFRGVMDWIAEGGLRLQEFTVLLGVVGDEAELRQLLAAQDVADRSPYAGAFGIHNLRWMLFSPGEKNPPAGAPPALRSPADFATKALVLSFVFDGDVRDTLEGLVEHASEAIEPILRHCHGFTAGSNVAKYLLERRLPSGFLFRDLGPLKASEPNPFEPYAPDATIAEIKEAQALETQFELFYNDLRGADPETLCEEFRREFGEHGFRFPLTPVERRFCDEERWVRRAAEIIRRLQALAARADAGKKRRRGVHAKAHGLIAAKFAVKEGIAPEYRVGLFQRAATFDAELRPSNGTHLMSSDRKDDARGLAISVHLPLGKGADDFTTDDFLARPDEGARGRQDFILMTSPVFFVPDIRRATVILSILASTPWYTQLVRALAYAMGSGTFRQLGIAKRALLQKLVHPLAAEFHSATPYKLGPDYVAKYSLELADRTRFDQLKLGSDPDYLSARLRDSLRAEPIELDFYLHVLPSCGTVKGGRSIQDAVEDATLDFDALGAKKVHVATISIGAQDPTTEEQRAAAEAWTFNPWHALRDHRPLGSLNRARLLVYRASQIFRNENESEAPGGNRPTTPPRSYRQAAE